MQIHGVGGRGSGMGYNKNGTTSLGNASSNANSSLSRFSVEAVLSGTGNSADKRKSHLLDVTSDEENSINSWDEAYDDEEDEDEIDVHRVSPTAVSTTSESSRGGSSPSINRSTNKLSK